ncbi:hypothetical protein [Parasediminibacterium sp. JCM 36343]|uniref:hypothetical protein n=1 Tax=Parasediminibacterium sp. JCM 36343 TaxID=3374279 RepID=UPI0039790DF2
MIDLGLKKTIVNEYLLGGSSYRQLGKKYGLSHWVISHWVKLHHQEQLEEAQSATLQPMGEALEKSGLDEVSSPAVQIKELQKQLAQERLHNKLLTAMIDVAEEELKIPIRKKYGTRQSRK